MMTQSFDPVLGRYEPVIGLEVHCQLATATKLFCGCSTTFGGLPNEQVCPICLGLPGSLPVLNRKAVDMAIMVGLAVDAKIHAKSVFSRKQYFYPDLPKGYQITQYDLPYCTAGRMVLSSGTIVVIHRIHLEEDAGKNVHGDDASFVDCNRAGMPLIEIVTDPCIHHPSDAVDYLRRLRSLVRHLGVSDGNMEEGSFRCDANVSLRIRGEQKLGVRCEIKNLNSFKNIERAIQYEVMRQADLLDAGELIAQQTVLFDVASGKTRPMRSKEESHDYRYFPDPDLPVLRIDEGRIAQIRMKIPELPEALAKRFSTDFELGSEEAAILTEDPDLGAYFQKIVVHLEGKVRPKLAANWLCTEYLREAKDRDWPFGQGPISAENFAKLLLLIEDQTISGKIAKAVFSEMATSGEAPEVIVERQGLLQISDETAIEALVNSVILKSPSQAAEYRAGKTKVFGYFVGQVMKESQGKMNPQLVNDILRRLLDS